MFFKRSNLQFKTIEYSNLATSDSLNLMRQGKLDALLIKNVLKVNEIDEVLKTYKSINEEEKTSAFKGMKVLPASFAMVNEELKTKKSHSKILNHNKRFWNEFQENLKFNLIDRISSTLSVINNNQSIKIPKVSNLEGIFNPACFKEMEHGKNGLTLHCGNSFEKTFSDFYSHLENVSIISDQLSYFITIKPSELGGELTLYNKKWKNVNKKVSESILKSKKGKNYDTKKLKTLKLKPKAGDLIVFAGGQIWHRVNPIEGNHNRITLGGFLSKAKNNNDFHLWS